MKMKVLDLFSGIGGFALGMEATGKFETAAFCEWDAQCQQALKKHWPGVPVHGDVTDLTCAEGSFDVITGGFPCQDISYAGRGAGLNGPRSGYWFEYLRLIQEIKPKGVIIENVSALRRRGLGTVLNGLSKVGYDAEWHCIPASASGAPHERDRIYILAYSNGVRRKRPWQCLQSIHSTPNEYREADRFVDAVQRKDLPFVCRGHDGISSWLDSVKQLGNAVCPPLIKQLGNHLHSNIKDM